MALPPLCLASFRTSQSVWGKASRGAGIPLTNPSLVIWFEDGCDLITEPAEFMNYASSIWPLESRDWPWIGITAPLFHFLYNILFNHSTLALSRAFKYGQDGPSFVPGQTEIPFSDFISLLASYRLPGVSWAGWVHQQVTSEVTFQTLLDYKLRYVCLVQCWRQWLAVMIGDRAELY